MKKEKSEKGFRIEIRNRVAAGIWQEEMIGYRLATDDIKKDRRYSTKC